MNEFNKKPVKHVKLNDEHLKKALEKSYAAHANMLEQKEGI